MFDNGRLGGLKASVPIAPEAAAIPDKGVQHTPGLGMFKGLQQPATQPSFSPSILAQQSQQQDPANFLSTMPVLQSFIAGLMPKPAIPRVTNNPFIDRRDEKPVVEGEADADQLPGSFRIALPPPISDVSELTNPFDDRGRLNLTS